MEAKSTGASSKNKAGSADIRMKPAKARDQSVKAVLKKETEGVSGEAEKAPDLYQFTNYRTHLQDHYQFQKRENPNFSLRYFAKRNSQASGY